MWEDGAGFETVVNQEMGDQFPYGMDPSLTNSDLTSGNTSVSGDGSAVNASRVVEE